MSLVTTRAQRRELTRQNSKLPKELQLVPKAQWPLELSSENLRRVWRSRDYLVQEYEVTAQVLVRLSVARTTICVGSGRWTDGITWDELQAIKNQCGYRQFDAVEIYPKSDDVVNVANMRHLWVMRDDVGFAWRVEHKLSKVDDCKRTS